MRVDPRIRIPILFPTIYIYSFVSTAPLPHRFNIAATFDTGSPNGTGDTTTAKLIATHDGAFQCDEALAVYLLRQTESYRDAMWWVRVRAPRGRHRRQQVVRGRDGNRSKSARGEIGTDVGVHSTGHTVESILHNDAMRENSPS